MNCSPEIIHRRFPSEEMERDIKTSRDDLAPLINKKLNAVVWIKIVFKLILN